MKNENIYLYYKVFIEFTSDLIKDQNIQYKKNIEELSLMKNKTELTKQINKLLKNNIIYVDELDLINKSNNKFGINIIDNKKIRLTEDIYNKFIDYVVYDLIYNNYRRNEIINNLFTKTSSIIDDINSNIYDEIDLNSEAIYELYNNRISDKFYQKIGDSYSKNNKVYNNNTRLCDNKIEIKDDDNKVYYYYNFNAMTKDTDMNYSDCIYIILVQKYLILKQIYDKIQENL